jgi:multimeric flavodoxin WrbA
MTGGNMISILNFSQHRNGINDRICEALEKGFLEKGMEYRYIRTRELKIGFCNNCRACMRSPGNELGTCTLNDDMQQLTASMLASDCIIVSAPINCYDLPSGMRVLLERMSIFCYWNDEMYAPKVRDTGRDIRGVLITTSALPGIMVPIVTRARKTFRLFAQPLQMKNVSYYHLGFKGRKADLTINNRDIGVVRRIINDLDARRKKSVRDSGVLSYL